MKDSLLKSLAIQSERGVPLRVGVVGAGKFSTMFLSQARFLSGLHIVGIVDLSRRKALTAVKRACWPVEQYCAKNFSEAFKKGSTCLSEDREGLISLQGLDVIVEATGDPVAGITCALKAIEQGKNLVMVNVEADAVAGPLLAVRAKRAGVVYSLAYGDQPALICEMVDWARSIGLEIVCAGKGTKYLPKYHFSTPETVWKYYGLKEEEVVRGGLNPRMFNSFLDGTKSAIEMAAVANATELQPQPEGLNFPSCGVENLAEICRPRSCGGQLSHSGTVEVVSSLERNGQPILDDLRWGVYVTFVASNNYVKDCFNEYGLKTDVSGRYSSLYRPYHLVGLELPISVLKVGLNREATGTPVAFYGDVVATAKRDLSVKEVLDGEGGYTVYGKLMPAKNSLKSNSLPIGLARDVVLRKDVPVGQTICWSDVDYDRADPIICFRREMEETFVSKI